MRKIFIILITSFVISSCASLTKTQVKSVYQFAQITKDFSSYPSKIMTELADIRFKRGIFYANSLSSPKLHISELDSIYNQKKFDLKVSDKVDITFKIIDKYSQSLLLLSSDKFEKDIEKQAMNFGVGIDSLISINNSLKGASKIPIGIGGAVSELVALGGKQYIRAKQAKEIKRFVKLADTLISTMTFNLIEYLQSKNICELIVNEEIGITRNYLSFLQQSPKATLENERDYLALKNNIDYVKQLQMQTIIATKNLRNAHKKLLADIAEKKDLKQSIKELQVLYEEVNDLKKTILKIEIN